MARGIDVASWQGYPNWPAVKAAGIEFAYIKATEGVNYVSPYCDRQWAEAKAAGLTIGLYHFARPGTNSPEAEAELFTRMVNAKNAKGPGMLPPCLDIEVAGGNLINWSARFIARLRQLIGHRRVMVYTYGSFYRDQLGGDATFDDDVMAWIAHFNGTPGKSPWLTGKTVIHQYSETGRVSGISGNVDLNESLRPLAEITGGTVSSGGDGDLTPEQDAILRRIEHELLGPRGKNGEIAGWGTKIGPRTVVAMLVDLHNALLAPEQSRVPGSQVQVSAVDCIRNVDGLVYQLPEMIAASGGANPEEVAQALRPVLAEVVGPVVADAVAEAVGEDNEETANAIVDALARRLAESKSEGQ